MRLRRASIDGPGITRRRRGRGFSYELASGRPVDDDETLARIRGLAIPPAWADVWIAPEADAHIQAVGTDAAGRRQYLYHERWRARRDAQKFDRMIEFARALAGAPRPGEGGSRASRPAEGTVAGLRDPAAGPGLLPRGGRGLREAERLARPRHVAEGPRHRRSSPDRVRLQRQGREATGPGGPGPRPALAAPGDEAASRGSRAARVPRRGAGGGTSGRPTSTATSGTRSGTDTRPRTSGPGTGRSSPP